jgi:hypothetical protein
MRAQFAELAALPESVPEVVPITCAGRSAVLAIRSQMVAFAGQRMSASRFETVCGKGDAKKWKSSIWLQGADGGQEQARARLLLLFLRVFVSCVVRCAS